MIVGILILRQWESFPALGGFLFVSVVRINLAAFHITEEDTSPICESIFSCYCFKNQVEISYPTFYPIEPSANLRGSRMLRKIYMQMCLFYKNKAFYSLNDFVCSQTRTRHVTLNFDDSHHLPRTACIKHVACHPGTPLNSSTRWILILHSI